jgi:hypothetical protein
MTTESDPYQRIIRRITILIAVIGVAGTIVFTATKGLHFGAGFLLGAAVSWVSFWRWKKVVDALAPGAKRRSAWVWLLRFAALAGVAYVIVNYLAVTPVAVFLGLLATAAAAIVSAIFELIYGT